MSKKKIMVVDDEEDIRYILRRFLEDEKYEVIEAKGGPQCFEMIKKEKPDLIILDILMPDMNGWEVSRKIKADESSRDIPISMLSVLSDPSDVKKSLTYASADLHLSKPIDFKILSTNIKHLLKERSRKPRPPTEPKRPPEGESDFFVPFGFDTHSCN